MMTLQTIFGAKFTKMIESHEMEKVWINSWKEGLKGMTTKQIYESLSLVTKRCKWPPTPAEFRELSIPSMNYEEMFKKAINAISTNQWPDKLTYWSSVSFNRYELQRTQGSDRDLKKWRECVDKISEEENLPEIPSAEQKQLEELPSTKEIAIEKLADIKKILPKYPYRKWAEFPKSARAVELMFSDPPMLEEIEIAKKNGYIGENNQWIPESKRRR